MKTQRHPYRPYVWITQHKPGWVYHYSPFICCRSWAVISSWPHCALWLYHPRGILIRASRCYSDTLPTAMRHSFNRKMCDIFKITNPQIFFLQALPRLLSLPEGFKTPKVFFKALFLVPGVISTLSLLALYLYKTWLLKVSVLHWSFCPPVMILLISITQSGNENNCMTSSCKGLSMKRC